MCGAGVPATRAPRPPAGRHAILPTTAAATRCVTQPPCFRSFVCLCTPSVSHVESRSRLADVAWVGACVDSCAGLDGPRLLEGLWGCLLSFTRHRDVEGVASPTLELWFFAPRLMGRHPNPACLQHLASLLPSLLTLLLDQCTPSEALCGDKEWARRLGSGSGSGEESEALEAVLAFRREACDTIQAIVSGWPQVRASQATRSARLGLETSSWA